MHQQSHSCSFYCVLSRPRWRDIRGVLVPRSALHAKVFVLVLRGSVVRTYHIVPRSVSFSIFPILLSNDRAFAYSSKCSKCRIVWWLIRHIVTRFLSRAPQFLACGLY